MALDTSGAAFVFVPGVFQGPIFYDTVISELKQSGHDAVAVKYPTVGNSTSGTTFEDEVRAVQEAVAEFVENQHKDVILVCHSYGGVPGSRAVNGWDAATRQQDGQSNGIIELVFIAAFLLPDNAVTAHYARLPDWMVNKGDVRVPNEKAKKALFSGLGPAQQQLWYSRLQPQENDFSSPTMSNAPWHLSVPKTYIFTMDDVAAPIAFQLAMLQGVGDSTWSLKSIHSDHEPMLSKPQQLAELLLSTDY